MRKDQSILITGAHGMLGKAITRLLTEEGYVNLLTPTRKELDLENRDLARAYLSNTKPVVVFHLASKVFGLKGNIDNQLHVFSSNTLINLNLIDACSATKVKKIVAAGTVAGYPFPFPRLPLVEEDFTLGLPHGGEYAYAQTKRHMLAHLETLRRDKKADYLFCLLTNLYGPGDNFDPSNGHVIPSLIYKAIASMKENDVFEVWGDGSQIRDFMYVDDAARAMLTAASTASGTLNISSGKGISLRQVVDDLCSILQHPQGAIWQSDMPIGIPERTVDNTKLIRLGFTTKTTLQDGLRRTVDWALENWGHLRGAPSH